MECNSARKFSLQSGSFSGSIDQVVKLLTRMEDKKLSKERENHNNFHHRAPGEEWEGACQKPKENLREHETGAKKNLFIELCFHFARVELKRKKGTFSEKNKISVENNGRKVMAMW